MCSVPVDMTPAKTVCVLGMHRSGTSVMSRMVELLGAYQGPESHRMPPRADNPKGFWEHLLLVAINDESGRAADLEAAKVHAADVRIGGGKSVSEKHKTE